MIDVEALKKYYEKKGKKVLTKQDIKNEKKFLKQAKKEKKFKDFLKKNKISDDVLNYIYESQAFLLMAARSLDSSKMPFLSTSRMTGTTKPFGVSTAMPML